MGRNIRWGNPTDHARVREGVGIYSHMTRSRDEGHVESEYSEMWFPGVVKSDIRSAYKQLTFPKKDGVFSSRLPIAVQSRL